MPKAAGNRAECTLTGVSTLPNCLRVKKYASFIINPCGCSMGGRNVSMVSAFILFSPCTSFGAFVRFVFVSLLQLPNVEFDHVENHVHDAFGGCRVLSAYKLAQVFRHYLPRYTEFVLEPAALHFLAAGGKFFPIII